MAAYLLTRRWWLGASLAVAMMLAQAPAASADGVRATVDRTEVTIEDQLLLEVTIEGTQRARPELPDLSAFEVVPRGTSRQFSSVNGRATSSITYTYVLIPKTTGSFTIGPATAEVDGRTYSSTPFTVRVLEASAQPQESRDVFTRASVSTTRPYVGQQVVYTWRFFRRVRVGEARLEPQEFTGFLVEDLGEVREYQATVGGQQFFVSEIKKALFPQEEGAVVVPGSRLTVQVATGRRSARRRPFFDDFFGATESKLLRTQPIELEVRPLPAPPAGFSGLVGDFDLRTSISKRWLAVGESTTLEISIAGDGNPRMISEPELPELSAFKVYDDRPSSSVERSGPRLRGSKTYTKALVPLVPGELEVPGFELVVFDPEAGSYRTERSEPMRLEVTPAEGEEELRLTEALDPTAGKVAVRILADDVLPLHRGLEVLDVPWSERRPLVVWLALLLPPLAYLAAWLVHRRRRRFAADAGLLRRRNALRTAQRCLRELGRDGADAEARASLCLRRYVGDKLGAEGSALTPAETEQLLRTEGVDEPTRREVRSLLERLEAARYGAASVDPGRLSDEIAPLIRRIERQVKR